MMDERRLRYAATMVAMAVSGAATVASPALPAVEATRVTVPEASAFILTRAVTEATPDHEVAAIGRVIASPGGLVDINAAISGQVAEVFVLPGSMVKEGDPIATVTSPDFIFTQRSYLELLANDERLEILRGEGNLPNYLAGARDNLRWWGMSEAQIDALVESGKLVERLNLVAPHDGVITEVLVQPGDMIDAGDRTMQNFIVLGRAVARLQRSDTPLMLEVTAFPDAPFGHGQVELQLPPEPSPDAVTPPPEVSDPDAAGAGVSPGPAETGAGPGLLESSQGDGEAMAFAELAHASVSVADEHAPIDDIPIIGGGNRRTTTPSQPPETPEPTRVHSPVMEKDPFAPEPELPDRNPAPAVTPSEVAAGVRLPFAGADGEPVVLPVLTAAPDIHDTTQQARALASLEGVEGAFVLGQSFPVEVVLEAAPGVWLPDEAVLSPDLGPAVYVAAPDGAYERREIEIAERIPGWVRVASGMQTGEKVVLRGKTLLEGAYRRELGGADHDDHHHHH